MPSKSKSIKIIKDGKTLNDESWNIIMPVHHEGRTRYVVENDPGTHMAIVNCIHGDYYITSGPTSWYLAEADAAAILFDRGSAVDELKAVVAGFLVLASKLRALPKFAHPYPYQNQTDEGV